MGVQACGYLNSDGVGFQHSGNISTTSTISTLDHHKILFFLLLLTMSPGPHPKRNFDFTNKVILGEKQQQQQ